MSLKEKTTYISKLKVRYSEDDRQNIVYNSHYLTYYDISLSEMLDSLFDQEEYIKETNNDTIGLSRSECTTNRTGESGIICKKEQTGEFDVLDCANRCDELNKAKNGSCVGFKLVEPHASKYAKNDICPDG